MNTTHNVWIVDDDKSIRWVLEKALLKTPIKPRCFSNGADLLQALQHEIPDALLTDIRMPGIDGLELLNKVKNKHPDLPVIIMTAHSDLDSAVTSFNKGAFEYLPKPFDLDEMVGIVERACQHKIQIQSVSDTDNLEPTPEIIGEAPAMQEVFRAIGRLAKSNITVLINGKSGTGKELVAKALHRHSPRTQKPFIALNMAAIPKDLMESELFGHEKGAFTGAQARRVGRFEQAHKGTLFLDEIGDMPAELQTRLLRVLADGEFYPVGGRNAIKVDVRIIAATHQNLESLVEKNLFREDLFHRLNVIRIHIPVLSERSQDIPLLMRHFLKKAAQELNTEVKILKPETEKLLASLKWPGNVRQLENTCRWLTVMAPGQQISPRDLPEDILVTSEPGSTEPGGELTWLHFLQTELEQQPLNSQDVLQSYQQQLEQVALQTALKRFSGHKQKAAAWLGWGRNTLTRKLKTLLK